MNRKYSDEQRDAAVAMVEKRRLANPRDRAIYREVARHCAVGEQSLRLWVRARDEERSGADKGRFVDENMMSDADLRAELGNLRRKIQKLQSENEVLKRAFVAFSSDWSKSD